MSNPRFFTNVVVRHRCILGCNKNLSGCWSRRRFVWVGVCEGVYFAFSFWCLSQLSTAGFTRHSEEASPVVNTIRATSDTVVTLSMSLLPVCLSPPLYTSLRTSIRYPCTSNFVLIPIIDHRSSTSHEQSERAVTVIFFAVKAAS